MTKFAAYDDSSIYAIADTAEAAIAKAREDAREPEAVFEAAPIGDDLAAQIEEHGWNGNRRSFEIDRKTGLIVDTTDA